MRDAATAQTAEHTSVPAGREPSLPLRGDTFFGVCEALGQDTRIPADLFRIAFAGLFFWNMGLAIGAYLGLGAVIALSRWLFPASPIAAVETDPDTVRQEEEPQLSLAA